MSDIVDFDFQQEVKFGDSYFSEETALPSSTNATTDAFSVAQVQSMLGIKVRANGAVVIANAATLKIELLHATTETGDFTDSVTLLDYTNSSGVSVTRADKYLFASYVPDSSIGKWCKLKYTTTTDLSAYKINAFQHMVAK